MATTLDDLINGLITAPTPLPQDAPLPQYSGFNITQAPLPKPLTDYEKNALRMAITSGGLTDLAGIFMGRAPEGRSNAALQKLAGAPRAIEDQTRAAQTFNAQQENQFGRNAQQQQASLERLLLQEQGRNTRSEDKNAIARQGVELADLHAQLAHQDRVRQLEIAAQNARTAEDRNHIMNELGQARNDIARLNAEKSVSGKPLDRPTRDSLNDFKTGAEFAQEALDFFNKETGGGAGGPVAGRMPTFMHPKSTQEFDTLRVKAQAALRKYLAGTAVSPTEFKELRPLLVDLSGTPTEIRAAMKGLRAFYDKKRISMLRSLETTGVRPDIAAEVRAQYGMPGDELIPSVTPPSPGTRVPSLPPGTIESNEEKIKRAKAAAGIR